MQHPSIVGGRTSMMRAARWTLRARRIETATAARGTVTEALIAMKMCALLTMTRGFAAPTMLAAPLHAQAPEPRFLYVYRDSVKRGADSAYRTIENDGARICADLRCPNPYIGIESLSGPHEAWWLNTFSAEADTARVASTYARDRALADALGAIARRKAGLIGTPAQGFGVYRRDLSRGPTWSLVGAQFLVITTTRDHRPVSGSVWMTPDSVVYIMRPARTLQAAEGLARDSKARIFVIRPNWSMPARAWVAADPAFWASA
jgi:hypothetical protein